MDKLTEFINESLVKLNVDKYLQSDEVKLTDVEQIEALVKSGKKEDRTLIAANPTLTVEQQTKLADDKVANVRQMLCCNPNLDVSIAKKLVKEEIERLTLIAKFGGSSLNVVVLEFLPKVETLAMYRIVESLLNSPFPTDETIEFAIKKHPDAITSTGCRGLYIKSLSKKSVYLLLDFLKKENNYSDATLSRLIVNQREHISEADIKKLDWKNSSDVQDAISNRDDISEKFTFDMLQNLSQETHLGQTNPHIKTVEGLNTIMQKYLTFKLSYKQGMDVFEDTENLSLDPKLMIAMVRHMTKHNYSLYAKNLLQNKFFPPYGIDEIGIDDENLKAIIASPAVDKKKIESIIEKFVINPQTAESVVWGMAERKDNIDLDVKTSEYILKLVSSKILWFEHMASGKSIDKVLDNLNDYVTYFTDFNYRSSKPKDSVLSCMAKNKNLTVAQRKKLLDVYDKLDPQEKLSFVNMRTALASSLASPDPDFFEYLMTTGGNIWSIWEISMGLSYWQYDDSVLPIIDKLALETKLVTHSVMNSQKTFGEWFKMNNFKTTKMSKETGLKYLLHFIQYGDNKLNTLMIKDEFLSKEWKTPEVMMAMYERTQDKKYLPDVMKDIFWF